MVQIIPIPALSDNYIWLIVKGKEVVIVDPGESHPVIHFIDKHQLIPKAILLTHNHQDHTDGVYKLCELYAKLVVFGPSETAKWNHNNLSDGDRFELLGHQFEVLKSAGHTAEHISYLVDSKALFCGDALFSGGCGRVIEGGYQAQFDTLQRFKLLPNDIKVYAGHEYTLANLAFAETVLPANCGLFEQIELAQIKRQKQIPTLPTTIGIELHINPFLQASTLEEFTLLRKQKDDFKAF